MSAASSGARPWVDAWQDALYGENGFYRRPEGPAGHFRTASHAAGAQLAAALARLARELGCTAVLDVGAGRGELLRHLRAEDDGLRLHGVDVVDRPAHLPEAVGWSGGLDALPGDAAVGALVVAWELLDVVPCPVLERDDDGALRVVEVDRHGRERLGAPADADDVAWAARWWPDGDRVEVGAPREALWRRLVRLGGVAVLGVDYGHDATARPPLGTLSAFRAGRQVPPAPDGTCDLTAEVAVDAVEAVGRDAGALTLARTTQSEALAALGVTDPELLDAGGLGAFAWLLQASDAAPPEPV